MKRIRRNKEVEIPEKWVGNFTTDKSKRQRRFLAEQKVAQRKKRLRDDEDFDYKNS